MSLVCFFGGSWPSWVTCGSVDDAVDGSDGTDDAGAIGEAEGDGAVHEVAVVGQANIARACSAMQALYWDVAGVSGGVGLDDDGTAPGGFGSKGFGVTPANEHHGLPGGRRGAAQGGSGASP